MPTEFTVFTDSNRNANTVYNSASVTIPDDQFVTFAITGIDLVNEPDTTIIYFTIEKSVSEAQPWTHMISGNISGRGGEPAPKPPGTIGGSIDGIVGQLVRGSMYFVSAGSQRKKFGVDGRTY